MQLTPTNYYHLKKSRYRIITISGKLCLSIPFFVDNLIFLVLFNGFSASLFIQFFLIYYFF